MSNTNMITNSLAIEVQPVEHAPKYSEDVKMVRITKAIVVPNGTVTDKPTVDLQMVDSEGTVYMAFITGSLLSALGKVIVANGGE